MPSTSSYNNSQDKIRSLNEAMFTTKFTLLALNDKVMQINEKPVTSSKQQLFRISLSYFTPPYIGKLLQTAKELGFKCEKLSDSIQMQMYLQPFQIGKGVKYSWLQCNQSIAIQVTETGRELNKSNYQSRIQYDMPFQRYIKIPQSSALCGLDKQRVYRLLLSSIGKIKNKRAQESSPSPSTATMCFF